MTINHFPCQQANRFSKKFCMHFLSSLLIIFFIPINFFNPNLNSSSLVLSKNRFLTLVIPIEKSGTLSLDETWSGEVLVTGDVTIPKGITLTILPGSIVRFVPKTGNDRLWIHVNGKLIAQGTEEQPITFTSAAENPLPVIGLESILR